jgi:hypothetical protein
MVKAAVGSAIGAGVGAAVWAAVLYFTSYELGVMALGIGVLAGGGAFLLAREDLDMATGLVAASIAVGGIAIGKFASVQFSMSEARSTILAGLAPSDAQCIASVADSLVEAMDREGKKVVWPAGMSRTSAKAEGDYPKEIWSKARAEWDGMSFEAREGVKERIVAGRRVEFDAAMAGARERAFQASLTPWDFLWFGLAVASAFKIGSASERD